MWIKREISGHIEQLNAKRPALLLTGARQTGKTSIFKRLYPEHDYVTLDVPLNAKQADKNGLAFLDQHPAPLIIDEIQYAPELFRQLKIQIDNNRSVLGQYLITGSQKFSLMKGVSESLAGRISIINLYSLSAREISNHFKLKPDSNNTLNWIVKGGYPEIYEHDLEPYQFFSDYLATYIERDVRQLLMVRHLQEFDQFMRLLATRSGQIFSMSRIATEVGVSANTIKSWISTLEASNIIYLVKPFYQNYGKRLIKSPKLYFLDTGLLCYLTNIQTEDILVNSPLLGAFYETFAFGQLLRNLHNQGIPTEIYYFRDKDGREIDFIIPEGSQIDLYECKWNDHSGEIPKNIKKLLPVVGKENIKSITTITNVESSVRVSEKLSVTNVVDL